MLLNKIEIFPTLIVQIVSFLPCFHNLDLRVLKLSLAFCNLAFRIDNFNCLNNSNNNIMAYYELSSLNPLSQLHI